MCNVKIFTSVEKTFASHYRSALTNVIIELKNKKDVCVVYMCKNNEYNVYKQYEVSFVSIDKI
jgi:hypothetical protein